jgi:hypothetical protein
VHAGGSGNAALSSSDGKEVAGGASSGTMALSPTRMIAVNKVTK